MPKRLALFFDGTWNKPGNSEESRKSDTNVCRLYQATPDIRDGSVRQETWYDKGVGTDWYDRVRGGVFGYGLDENIRQGYSFLINHYEDNAKIYLFGFSRGAYTARSLVGLIRKCGLLRHTEKIDEAYELYRTRSIDVDAPEATAFVDENSYRPDVEFIGVWDTVGALGIPLHALHWLNQAEYAFHDVELSKIVRNAYQAIALDEWREDYVPCLWEAISKEDQKVEQVWFAGAHSDVGGGYAPEEDGARIANIPMMWLAQAAIENGLEIDLTLLANTPVDFKAPIHDSYADFLDGVYAVCKAPFKRTVDLATQAIAPEIEKRMTVPDLHYFPANPGLPWL